MTVATQGFPAAMPMPALRNAFLANLVWINLSEVLRYFVFVMPMMRAAFPQIADVAPMNLPVFLVWGIWDTILVAAATVIPWMALDRFGNSIRNAVLAGAAVWVTIFGILWLGLFNMNLATPGILAAALPLALFEMVVAALIVGRCLKAPARGRAAA